MLPKESNRRGSKENEMTSYHKKMKAYHRVGKKKRNKRCENGRGRVYGMNFHLQFEFKRKIMKVYISHCTKI